MPTATKAQQRATKPRNYWKKKGPRLSFGAELWKVLWIPGTGRKRDVSPYVEGVTWDDASAILTGSLQFRPDPGAPIRVGVGDQFQLSCALHPGAAFNELWRMRVQQPSTDFGVPAATFDLANDLALLQRSTDDFSYSAGKKRPQGWLAHEIALDIAHRYGLPVGVIARTTHRIKKLVMLQASPLDALAAAYKREKTYTHKRFVIQMYHGKLNIIPLRRSPDLLVLGPTLIAASFQQQMGESFASEVTVRAQATTQKPKDKKGKKRTSTGKIVLLVKSPAAIKKFGVVHRDVWAHDATSVAGARNAALRHLSLVGQPEKQLDLSHPGIPSIRRGDAIRAALPDPALNQVIFVTDARHTLTGATYEMGLQFTFSDPFVDALKDQVDEDRYGKAKAKGRKQKGKAKAPPQAKKAGQRAKTTPGQKLTQRGHPGGV